MGSSKVKSEFNFSKLESEINHIFSKKINVGLIGDKVSDKLKIIGAVHEYGCVIKVTQKMRAFLHREGLHLKKETAVIVIPERSYIRATLRNANQVKKVVNVLIDRIPMLFQEKISAEKILKEAGVILKGEVQETITKTDYKALHPFTIEKTGRDKPLINRGILRASINFEVKNK